MTGHGIQLNTLKQCLQFLMWLNHNKQSSMKTDVATQLSNRLKGKYKTVNQREIEKALSTFLSSVFNFHSRLCSRTDKKKIGNNPNDALNALLECIPKFLAVMYFLRYQVDHKFGKLGGGKWKDQMVVYSQYAATEIQKYLTASSGSKDYGVIPGGFSYNELKRGRRGSQMTGDLEQICEKYSHVPHIQNYFLDVFSTSVLPRNSGTQDSNTANALALVSSLCEMVAAEGDTETGGELKQKLDESLNGDDVKKCICWSDLKDHCQTLQSQIGTIYKTNVFSFTGFKRNRDRLSEKEFAKETAKWLRGNLAKVKTNLDKIETDITMNNLTGYFTINLFPYGFTFDKNNFGSGMNPRTILNDNWRTVIEALRRDREGLERLKQILEGEACPTEKKEDDEDHGKKSDGAQNQGKKSEGAQNQGKKVESSPNHNNGRSENQPSGSAVVKDLAPSPPAVDQGVTSLAGPTGVQHPQGPTVTVTPASSLTPDSPVQNVVQTQQVATQDPRQPPPPPPPPTLPADPGSPGKPGDQGPGSPGGDVSGQQPVGPPVPVLTQHTGVTGPGPGPTGVQGAGHPSSQDVSQGSGHGSSSGGTTPVAPASGGGVGGSGGTGGKGPPPAKKCKDSNFSTLWTNPKEYCDPKRTIRKPSPFKFTKTRDAAEEIWESQKKALPDYKPKPSKTLQSQIPSPHSSQRSRSAPVPSPSPNDRHGQGRLPIDPRGRDAGQGGGVVPDDGLINLRVDMDGAAVDDDSDTRLKKRKDRIMADNEVYEGLLNLIAQQDIEEKHKLQKEAAERYKKDIQRFEEHRNKSLRDAVVENVVPIVHKPLPVVQRYSTKKPVDMTPPILPPLIDVASFNPSIIQPKKKTVPSYTQMTGFTIIPASHSPQSSRIATVHHSALVPVPPLDDKHEIIIQKVYQNADPTVKYNDGTEVSSTFDIEVRKPLHQDSLNDYDHEHVPKIPKPRDPKLKVIDAFSDKSSGRAEINIPLAVFPGQSPDDLNSNFCSNPWYVPDSSSTTITPTPSPPPDSDNLPPPKTVREMLCWLVGMTQYGYVEIIKKHVADLLREYKNDVSQSPDAIYVTREPYNLDASHVSNTLTEACHYAANVLFKMKYKDSKIAFKDFKFDSVYRKLHYSPDPACLLCQLRDYVYACCHQLAFLKSQCSRNTRDGGWQDCHYGSDVSSPKSPLQAFLTDAPESNFKTHPFDPCNICRKSRVNMGFTKEDFSKDSKYGKHLHTILSPTCGGEDPLLTLTSYLNCLTRRTPRTTGELVSFFHNFGNSLHNAPSQLFKLGSALSSQHDHCPDWDSLAADDLRAVQGIRGSAPPIANSIHDKDHPNTLSTLLGCGTNHAPCHPHMMPITYRAYALYSKAFVHHYLSWAVYLADRLWESLEKLSIDMKKHYGTKCLSLHQCDNAMPLLYTHGFTPPDGTLQSSLTCSKVIAKLREVVAGEAIASLMTAMDTFLYGIREPFIYTLFTLWLTATVYILHSLLYRMDVLRIRSHLLTTRASHLIDVKALLAGSRRMLSLYKDVDYFDDDFHS
ncbi:ribosome binding protein [Babesia ovata]|uniref:Ribosome binding protein n=1 Tax=Babesia ovata TaxID=189622 RepID=A0A2H6KAI5_9APIC|nr:ribosome binding protein [Babesia ovata]GBE60011.1 ribosome binding protein [Babesia ovata]